jgi:hypothetical protein
MVGPGVRTWPCLTKGGGFSEATRTEGEAEGRGIQSPSGARPCSNSSEIVIFAELLESPKTLNTNVQKRCFGVERLQIVFLSLFLEICISCGPCRVKRNCVAPQIWHTLCNMYECPKRNVHFCSRARIPHNAQHKCSQTVFWCGVSAHCVFVAFPGNLHFVRPTNS